MKNNFKPDSIDIQTEQQGINKKYELLKEREQEQNIISKQKEEMTLQKTQKKYRNQKKISYKKQFECYQIAELQQKEYLQKQEVRN